MGAPDVGTLELRILAYLADGHTIDVTARAFGISSRTVRRRVRDVCDEIGVRTPIEAIAWAARRRLI